jgi:hypothetical protein
MCRFYGDCAPGDIKVMSALRRIADFRSPPNAERAKWCRNLQFHCVVSGEDATDRPSG